MKITLMAFPNRPRHTTYLTRCGSMLIASTLCRNPHASGLGVSSVLLNTVVMGVSTSSIMCSICHRESKRNGCNFIRSIRDDISANSGCKATPYLGVAAGVFKLHVRPLPDNFRTVHVQVLLHAAQRPATRDVQRRTVVVERTHRIAQLR